MSYSTTEETQVIGESTSALSQGKFTILTKLLSQILFFSLWVLGCGYVIIRMIWIIVVFVNIVVVIPN